MKFEIKHRFTGAVLFELECGSLRICVEAAVKARADLTGADLTGADLAGANLARANLTGADLTGADLTGADLAGAYLADPYLDVKPATKDESIAALDKVREIILDNQARLDMTRWHDNDEWQARTCAEEMLCETTHCMAGWLQVCSTDPKIRELPPNVAGVLCAPVAAKMFYRDNEETFEWLRDRKYVADAEEAEIRRDKRLAGRETTKD